MISIRFAAVAAAVAVVVATASLLLNRFWIIFFFSFSPYVLVACTYMSKCVCVSTVYAYCINCTCSFAITRCSLYIFQIHQHNLSVFSFYFYSICTRKSLTHKFSIQWQQLKIIVIFLRKLYSSLRHTHSIASGDDDDDSFFLEWMFSSLEIVSFQCVLFVSHQGNSTITTMTENTKKEICYKYRQAHTQSNCVIDGTQLFNSILCIQSQVDDQLFSIRWYLYILHSTLFDLNFIRNFASITISLQRLNTNNWIDFPRMNWFNEFYWIRQNGEESFIYLFSILLAVVSSWWKCLSIWYTYYTSVRVSVRAISRLAHWN